MYEAVCIMRCMHWKECLTTDPEQRMKGLIYREPGKVIVCQVCQVTYEHIPPPRPHVQSDEAEGACAGDEAKGAGTSNDIDHGALTRALTMLLTQVLATRLTVWYLPPALHQI